MRRHSLTSGSRRLLAALVCALFQLAARVEAQAAPSGSDADANAAPSGRSGPVNVAPAVDEPSASAAAFQGTEPAAPSGGPVIELPPEMAGPVPATSSAPAAT